jgi:hypothetical protein
MAASIIRYLTFTAALVVFWFAILWGHSVRPVLPTSVLLGLATLASGIAFYYLCWRPEGPSRGQ